MPKSVEKTSRRPYRSHLHPACAICRKRKIRCHVEVDNQACRFCRENGLQCLYSTPDTAVASSAQRTPVAAMSTSQRNMDYIELSSPGALRQPPCDRTAFAITNGASPEQTYVLVQPGLAEDVATLKEYLSARSEADGSNLVTQYSLISSQQAPIVYLKIPRVRKGYSNSGRAGEKQVEIIRHVLGSAQRQVVDIFFRRFHACFPVIDEQTFTQIWQEQGQTISPALLCTIYANGLVFWQQSGVSHRQKPDAAFVWNQAVAALQEDFGAPTISTLHAAILDLSGRPVLDMQGNILTCGRAITLAYGLGLHRDPSGWQIPQDEKSARVRLWWALKIHDAWSSVAHGTPPLIQGDSCDTMAPSVAVLKESTQDPGVETFHYLCTVTQILSGILPLVHSVHIDGDQLMRAGTRFVVQLDDWEASLPIHLRPQGAFQVNGSSNLWFCYLFIRLLLCRLSLRAAHKKAAEITIVNYWRVQIRAAAVNVVEYAGELTDEQLNQFWLPYTAYMLVSAVTTLLRYTIEASERSVKESCASSVKKMLDHLTSARLKHDWDLADMLLDQSRDAIERVCRMVFGPPPFVEAKEGAAGGCDPGFTPNEGLWSSDDPFLLPMDFFEMPWEHLLTTSDES